LQGGNDLLDCRVILTERQQQSFEVDLIATCVKRAQDRVDGASAGGTLVRCLKREWLERLRGDFVHRLSSRSQIGRFGRMLADVTRLKSTETTVRPTVQTTSCRGSCARGSSLNSPIEGKGRLPDRRLHSLTSVR
jgi:hypothetical protein